MKKLVTHPATRRNSLFSYWLKLLGVLLLCLNSTLGWGQVSITSINSNFSENFDGLVSTGSSSTVPAGWAFSESGTNADINYSAGTGSSNAGDSYSYGSNSATDRAFGGLQSGSLIPVIGGSFTNNTGATIRSLTISYTGEQWRLGATGRVDRMDFQYSTNATSLTTGTWTDENSLDFTAPVTTGSTGALDGNLSANKTAISYTITGLNISDGSTFWIRWNDFNASGADDGMGVDDFTINAPCVAPSLSATPTNETCPASDNGSIDLSVTGGTSPFTYLWSDNMTTTEDISGLDAGTYSVTVTATGGCTAQLTGIIIGTTNADPNAGTISGAAAVCEGNTTTFTSNGDAGGDWTSNDPFTASVGISSGIVTGVAAGGPVTITYSVTNVCGTDDVTKDIMVDEQPTVDASGTQTLICEGDYATLSAFFTGASGITWTTSGTGTFDDANDPGTNYNPSAGDYLLGTVTLTVTTSTNACGFDDDFVVLTFLPVPVVSAANNGPVCVGDPFTLDGTVSGGSGMYSSYTWTGVNNLNVYSTLDYTKPVAVASDDDTYNLVVYDANGCPGEAQTTLVVNVPSTWYQDADVDGYHGAVQNICGTPSGSGWSLIPGINGGGDCNDNNAAINPGAAEICNSIDDDCDGLTDSADPGITGQSTWYRDLDTDTYGDINVTTLACTQPVGYVFNNSDCDDTNGAVKPGATEICNGIDDDCDGDTDDDDAGITGQASWYADADGDSYGDLSVTVLACLQPVGYVANSTDCDDADIFINPGASDINCNGIDENCSGTNDDGYVPVACDGTDADLCTEGMTSCVSGVVQCSDNSGDDVEMCDGLDNDCDGLTDEGVTSTFYADADGDTFGNAGSSVQACTAPSGFVADNTDCNDIPVTGTAIHPGANEVCNTIDDDCDGFTDDADPSVTGQPSWYADTDGDTYGNNAVSTTACTQPVGYVSNNTDCNDGSATINPGAAEVCNSIDDDCDAFTDENVGIVHNSTANTYHCTIQAAINAATTGDVINVPAGTYAEDIIVNKSVSLLGPNAAIDPCSGTRVAEAIIVPATADIAYREILHVAASNVTISGFTIDGDNTSLTSGFTSTNGADIDAAEGVTVYETGINNLTVSNNIIQNLSYFGVTLYDYPAGVPSSGHSINNNKIQNLGTYDATSLVDYWGGGVLLYNNQYAAISGNCMSNVRLGIQTGNFSQANPGSSAAQVISGNTIEARRTGVFHNLHYGAASPMTFSTNSIEALANANETKWDGIALSSLAVPSVSISNSIDGNGISVSNLSKGYEIWNVAAPITNSSITGGSITGVDIGVFANNYDGYASNAPDGAHATIVNLNITPKATGVGVRIFDNPLATSHAPVRLDISGSGISGCLEGIKFEESQPGTVGGSINNNSISVAAVGVNVNSMVTSGSNIFTLSNNDITLSSQLAGSTPTVGVSLRKLTGTSAAVVSDNIISGAFYGYLGYNVNTSPISEIAGGTISGVLQGVAFLNIDPVTFSSFDASNAVVKNLTMNNFTGNHPSLPNNNFHAGVYAFTTGSNTSATLTLNIKEVSIDGTGKTSPASAAIVPADFSTGAGVRQTITVDSVTLSNNLNRGISVRGANAVVDINNSTLSNNGGDPYGLGGNDGFGIIVREGSNVTADNNFITNPATNVGYSVFAMATDPGTSSGVTLTAANNSIGNNGNPVGKLAGEFGGTLEATCNWWGTGNLAAIAAGMTGGVNYMPMLTGGTDNDAVMDGFQPAASCAMVLAVSVAGTPTDETCSNLNDGSVDITPAGGIAPYTFAWSNSATTEDLTGLDAGTYTVVVTDAYGNTATNNFTVGTLATATLWYADADGDTYGNAGVSTLACIQPVGYVSNSTDCNDGAGAVNPGASEVCNAIDDDCDGLTDDADPSISGQPTWYADADGDNYGNSAVSSVACTQPVGYVSNSTDCNDTDASVNPGTTEICNNVDDDCDGITDEGMGPYTITPTAAANGSISPSTPQSIACQGSQTFNFYPDPGYVVSDVLVNGSSVGSPSSYTFNNVNANATIDVSFALVTCLNPPTIFAGTDIHTCITGDATLNALIGGGATTVVSWTGGLGTYSYPNFPDLSEVVYTPDPSEAGIVVTLTATTDDPDGAGPCVAASDDVEISIDEEVTVDAGADIRVCSVGGIVSLNGIVSGGASAGIWSGGSGTFSPNANTLAVQYIPDGSETGTVVTLTLTPDMGTNVCPVVPDNVFITVDPEPIANAGSDLSVCDGGSIALNGSVTNASGGVWSGGLGTFTPSNTNLNATYTPDPSEVNTIVTLTLTTTDPLNVCPAGTDDVDLTVSEVTVNAGPDIHACEDGFVGLSGIISGGATTGQWSGGLGTFSPSSTDLNATYTPDPSEAGTVVTLTLTSDPGTGCPSVSDQIDITIDQLGTVNAGPSINTCVDGTANLNGIIGGGAIGGIWTGGIGTFTPSNTSLNVIYTPDPSEVNTTVTLTLTAVMGPGNVCIVPSDQLDLIIEDVPTAEAGTNQSVCFGGSVTLNGSLGGGAVTATWTTSGDGTFNNANALNAVYTPGPNDLVNGNVWLTLTPDPTGVCYVLDDDVFITFFQSLSLNVTGTDVTCTGANDGTATANVTGGLLPIDYLWNNGALTSSISGLAPGTYTVTVTDDNGCFLSDDVTISTTVDITPPATPVLATLTGECSVTATAPTTTDNCAGTVTGTTTDPLTYTAQGSYTINWTFDDGNGNSIVVPQSVIVDDVTDPATPVLATLTGECSVTATAPTTTDNCAGTVTGTTTDPLTYTAQGSYTINWTFDDGNGNSIVVPQSVIVDDVTNPATPVLATLTGECSVTAIAPTTTDNCAGTVTGTTTDPLTYTAQGSYTINWTFDDGNGNSIVVPQSVIVDDVTNPATPVLATLTGECSVTAIAPTTTDNCAGTVTGTTTDPLTYTAQGSYTINWTFDDGNGNSIVVPQSVIVDDVTNPATPVLATLTGECSVTATAPTTTDNCAGTVTGTTTDPLTYTAQGSYTINWTFDDGNGNSIVVPQSVIVDDVTNPATPVLATLTGECSVTATAPTTTDNCVGTVTGTTTDPLTYTAQGSYTINWTFDDGNGNSIVVPQSVIVDDVTNPATPVLATLTGECSVTATAPTTTDNCAGTVTGTTTDPLTYTAQGSYTINWTFDDGNGNSIVVPQSVIVDDVTDPSFSGCPSNITQCGAVVTWTPPTPSDNCVGYLVNSNFNSGASFPVGTTTVTYTVTDVGGNTATCSFDVTITPTPVWYADNDNDTYGDPLNPQAACTQPVGYVFDNSDCNDNNGAVNPAATEICNGIDDDCDGDTDDDDQNVTGQATWYADADGDTYGDISVTQLSCSQPVGYVANSTDCDDADASINPGASEICNNIDDDCDGSTDEGLTFTNYYVDADGDGYGVGTAQSLCYNPGPGFATQDGDCNDAVATINPGAQEICDNIDNDCDGLTDSADPSVIGQNTWYADADGDTYGNAMVSLVTCFQPVGYVFDNSDCNDNNNAVNPGATEVCNGIDDDCDGDTDDDDQNITGQATWYADADGDTYGDISVTQLSCSQPVGYVANSTDCDDADASINPGATESCNNIDDDCDGLTDEGITFTNYYVDADGDSYGVGAAQSLCYNPGAGFATQNGDCNDAVAAINPGATEICNGIDDDCDGLTDDADPSISGQATWYADADGDTYGNALVSVLACTQPVGYVSNNTDCNDGNGAVNPGATEICNGIDDDCDGLTDDADPSISGQATWYADADGDTYGNALVSVLACTQPVGYVSNNTDCNDGNGAVNPGATEICNGIDDDCDGLTDDADPSISGQATWYADADGDTYGNAMVSVLACTQPVGYVSNNTDCNDGNGAVNPGATEICNGIDDDCDGLTDDADPSISGQATWYADADGDTYGNALVSVLACTQPVGYVSDNTDCNDGNGAVNPGATEICNGIDDDCDGLTDDADPSISGQATWYADADGDTYGNAMVSVLACTQPVGYVSNNTDCNDGNGAVNPGATEICNGIDDDCDGLTDDADPSISGQATWYADADGDTYGNALVSVLACTQPVGYVSNNTDCNDGNGAVNPGATEICNGIDDDCDGLTDDADPSISGQATWYADADGDTYGNALVSVLACTQPVGYVSNNTDCNDGNGAVNPGATEICNGIDDDCDGLTDDADPSISGQATWYADADGDTYGNALVSVLACTQPVGYVSDNTDCNDGNGAVNPGATEICNGIDDDCDGLTDDADPSISGQATWYADADGDTYGNALVSVLACTQPVGYVSNNTDCNDGNGAVNPGATEICNGIDDDCDGLTDDADPSISGQATWYADADGDTYGNAMVSVLACTQPVGYVSNNTDCNDGNGAVNPGATEICNGIDDDCDGLTDDADPSISGQATWYADADGDTYGNAMVSVLACTQPVGYVSNNTDCNDGNGAVNPGATEICNGIDDDCDGLTDDADPSISGQATWYADADGDTYGNALVSVLACTQPVGYVSNNTDCNDGNGAVNPGATEICNGIDDDCDGLTDDADPSISGQATWYADADGDTYGNAMVSVLACTQPVGYVSNNTDCNDGNGAVNPGATEICNGIDDDCDGLTDDADPSISGQATWYADADGDTYGNAMVSVLACTQPVGYVSNNTDCDDLSATVYPGATEICGNSIDDDCDGLTDEFCITYTYYADTDGDSYGDPANFIVSYSPIVPPGYVTNNSDCNDASNTVYPGAIELCNGVDDDCNGLIDDGLLSLPTPGSITGPLTGCVPATFGTATYSVGAVSGASNYTWNVPSGFTILSGQGTTTITVQWTNLAVHNGIVGQLCVDASGTCGSSLPSCSNIEYQIAIPVTPSSISGPAKVCPGETATYSILPVFRAKTYNWTVPTGMTILTGAGTNVITVSVNGLYTGGTMSVSATNVCGTGVARTKTMSLNFPLTPGAISGQKYGLCLTNGVPFSIAPVAGATSYIWTASSGITIASGQGTTNITADVALLTGTGTLTVVAVNNCGNSPIRSVNIFGIPDRPQPVTGASPVCTNALEPYSVPTVAGTSLYTWTVTAGGSVSTGQGTKNITVQWGATPAVNQTLTVIASNACGNSAVRSLAAINVNSCPRISDDVSSLQTVVYPNPARDFVTIQFNSENGGDYTLHLTDMLGRVVYNENGTAESGINTKHIRLGDLQTGVYFVNIATSGVQETLRLIIE